MSVYKLKARVKRALSFSTILRRRLIDFYAHWPGLVGIAAIVLMTFAAAELTPLATVLVTMGTALLLILIGHAATRSQLTAHVAQSASNQALAAARTAQAVAQQALAVSGRSGCPASDQSE